VVLAAGYGRLTWPVLVDSTMRTVRITAMILFIVTCGSIFAAVFVGSGGLQVLTELMQALNLGRWGLFAIVMAITFLAGFMLDPLVIILIIVPIATPLVTGVGFDVVWFCVVFLVMLQTAYLTPPMAPSIFYLRGIAPPSITLRDMYVGIWPFIGLQVMVVTLIIVFPDLVTWLPTTLTKR
jgi:TRAP-type mannitol/chloroaromatic compound transport system permease large subunit